MVVANERTLKGIKKSYILVAVLLLVSVVTSMFAVRSAQAAALTQVFVRYDRLTVGTGTTGTICAKPATVGTETTVKVGFPTGYTLGVAGAFTVNTTNTGWPSGGTAWPSINTATAVSSQDVTFPSGDLTVGTLYCFNWGSTSAVTTQGSTSNTNTTTVTTQAAGPTPIDSATAVSSTITNDSIAVSATVPQAFSFALSGTTDALGTLSVGAVGVSPTPRTVTVNTNAKNGWLVWGKDAYQGLCSPSIGTCTDGSATATLDTTATGSNRTLVAGTSDVNLGVSTTAGTVATAFDYASTPGRGGGLSATALQTLVSSTTPVSNGVITLRYQAAISGTEAAATDYVDTVTVTGAGLF